MTFPWINDPQQVLARTIWAEDRSGGYIGMQAVANSIMNRAATPSWWGHDVLSVCLKPWQYSVWNPLTANQPQDADYRAAISVTDDDENFRFALQIAQLAMAPAALPDITEGADSYYALSIPAPDWAKKAIHTVNIGGQAFYRTV